MLCYVLIFSYMHLFKGTDDVNDFRRLSRSRSRSFQFTAFEGKFVTAQYGDRVGSGEGCSFPSPYGFGEGCASPRKMSFKGASDATSVVINVNS